MSEAVHTAERLKELQALPLERKIQVSQARINGGETMAENINANNPIVQFNLDKPLIWLQFSELPEDAKVEYIKKLRKKYRCSAKQLANMFGCKVSWVEDWLVSHGIDNVIRQREDRKKAWEAFTGIVLEPEAEETLPGDGNPIVAVIQNCSDAEEEIPYAEHRFLTISEIEALDPLDRRPDERERLARVYSIPTAVKAICRKRAEELLIEVKGLEAERDAILNFLEGWT